MGFPIKKQIVDGLHAGLVIGSIIGVGAGLFDLISFPPNARLLSNMSTLMLQINGLFEGLVVTLSLAVGASLGFTLLFGFIGLICEQLIYGLIFGFLTGFIASLFSGLIYQIIAYFSNDLVFSLFCFQIQLGLLVIVEVVGWTIIRSKS